MSNIEWTDETWNPVVGCTPVSPGCLNCYAATMANRMQAMPQTPEYHPRPCVNCGGMGAVEKDGVDVGCPECRQNRTIRIAEVRNGRAVFTGEVRTVPSRLDAPLHWEKPRRVFVNSMSDLFHEAVPFEFVDRVWEVMYKCPRHTFQILTKRPERMAAYFEDVLRSARKRFGDDVQEIPLPNVWLGTSVEDQARADERIPHLLRCPAAVRFLSCEPLLESVWFNPPGNLSKNWGATLIGIDWVIVGGESGHGARPCDVAWIRGIVGQCKAAGVPCFVKQLGSMANDPENGLAGAAWPRHPETEPLVSKRLRNRKGGDPAEWPEDLRVREWPTNTGARQ